MIITIAWMRSLHPCGPNDIVSAVRWKQEGNSSDIAEAEKYAAKMEGAVVFWFPETETDPLGKTKEQYRAREEATRHGAGN